MPDVTTQSRWRCNYRIGQRYDLLKLRSKSRRLFDFCVKRVCFEETNGKVVLVTHHHIEVSTKRNNRARVVIKKQADAPEE